MGSSVFDSVTNSESRRRQTASRSHCIHRMHVAAKTILYKKLIGPYIYPISVHSRQINSKISPKRAFAICYGELHDSYLP